MIIVDAANVIGSRPDGWWRDRAGAARTFVEHVRAAVEAGRIEPPVCIVLEGRARAGAAESATGDVEVVHASGAGDDSIEHLAMRRPGAVVITADRALGERVRAAGAEVVGPTWLIDRLER